MSNSKALAVVEVSKTKVDARSKIEGGNDNTKNNLRELVCQNKNRNYHKYFEVLDIDEDDRVFIPFLAYGEEEWFFVNDLKLREMLFVLTQKTMKQNWRGLIDRNEDTPHDEMCYVSKEVLDAMENPIDWMASKCVSGLSGSAVRELLDLYNISNDDLDLSIPREKFYDLCLKTCDTDSPYLVSTKTTIYGSDFDVNLKPSKLFYFGDEKYGIVGIGLMDVMGAFIPVGIPIDHRDSFNVVHQDNVPEKSAFRNPEGHKYLYKDVKGKVVKGLEDVLTPGKQRAGQGPSSMFSMIFGGQQKEKSPWVTAEVSERLILDGDFFTSEKMGMIENIIDESAKELGSKLVSLPNTKMDVSDYPNLRTLVPLTVGYGVKSKALLIVTADKISDPVWNSDAVDKLVLDKRCKAAMVALLNTQATNIDFIEDKGRNTSFLFIGAPGTGKTLTAEVLSENIRKPLLKLNISDLSSKMEDIEKNLTRYTSIAARWDVPLLIDEADVLIEERNINNLERNGIVATVLQILEYHTSTLFLSSNRVNSIDPAIRSRITFNVQYKTPDMRPIWKDLLSRADLVDSEIEKLNDPAFFEKFKEITNGREVKNIISVAMRTCAYQEETLTIDHVLETLNFMVEIK